MMRAPGTIREEVYGEDEPREGEMRWNIDKKDNRKEVKERQACYTKTDAAYDACVIVLSAGLQVFHGDPGLDKILDVLNYALSIVALVIKLYELYKLHVDEVESHAQESEEKSKE